MQLPLRSASPSSRGGALLISLIAALLIAGFVAAAYTLSYAQSREVAAVAQRKRALYLADAGISDAIIASKDNAETFILAGGQPSNASLLNKWGEQQQYQVFKSIAQGIANGHHLAQFADLDRGHEAAPQ